MTARQLYRNITIGGVPRNDSLISVDVSESYKQVAARCSIELSDVSGINLNQVINIDIGYPDNHEVIFIGYVDDITYTRLPGTYIVTGRDILKLALEYWLVSEDLDNPWSRKNIQAENLVRDLLHEAGITNYNGAHVGFTFGVNNDAEFNLMSVWDAVRTICHILAYNCWAEGGTVYFDRVFPYPEAGDPIEHSFNVGTGGNIILVDYEYSTEELRNRVVVFGKDKIHAEVKTSSPYLPPNFYKTAIVSSELIETQKMADASASYNLNLYNKLTETLRVEAEGDPRVRCRDIVGITEPFIGMSNDKWFVYDVTHRLDDNGYKISMSLSR